MEWKLLLTVFGAVFVAEMADKTQLVTMLFAADKEVVLGDEVHIAEIGDRLYLLLLGLWVDVFQINIIMYLIQLLI